MNANENALDMVSVPLVSLAHLSLIAFQLVVLRWKLPQHDRHTTECHMFFSECHGQLGVVPGGQVIGTSSSPRSCWGVRVAWTNRG